jgi:hypothetical protein
MNWLLCWLIASASAAAGAWLGWQFARAEPDPHEQKIMRSIEDLLEEQREALDRLEMEIYLTPAATDRQKEIRRKVVATLLVTAWGFRNLTWNKEQHRKMLSDALDGMEAETYAAVIAGVPQSSEQKRTLSPARSASRHASGRIRRVIGASCEMHLQGGHHRQ